MQMLTKFQSQLSWVEGRRLILTFGIYLHFKWASTFLENQVLNNLRIQKRKMSNLAFQIVRSVAT